MTEPENIIALIAALAAGGIFTTAMNIFFNRHKIKAESNAITTNSVVQTLDITLKNVIASDKLIRNRLIEVENKANKNEKKLYQVESMNYRLKQMNDKIIQENKELKKLVEELKAINIQLEKSINELLNKSR